MADFVPTNKEAKFGGFYINSGLLDFKEVPKDEESDDEIGERRPYKKRKVTTAKKSKRSSCNSSKRSLQLDKDCLPPSKYSKVELYSFLLDSDSSEPEDYDLVSFFFYFFSFNGAHPGVEVTLKVL